MPSEFIPGCIIDGHWGIYSQAKMVLIAADFGFTGKEVKIAKRLMIEHDMPGVNAHIREGEWDILNCTDAENWLNETVAPEGYSFGWNNGEFFLWSTGEWNELDDMQNALEDSLREKGSK